MSDRETPEPPFVTHRVANQPPPLEGHDAFAGFGVLAEALRREGGGWAEERARELGLVCGRAEPGVRQEDLQFEGPRGAIAARLYRPPSPQPGSPLVVHASPGRAGQDDLSGGDAFCSILARCGRDAKSTGESAGQAANDPGPNAP